MSGTKPDTGLLKSAAISSYIMGAWYFLSVIVAMALAYVVVLPIVTPWMSGYTPSLPEVTQLVDAILMVVLVVVAITIAISIIFGYYTYKVGAVHGLGSLKVAGVSLMLLSVALIPLVYGLYQLPDVLTNAIGLPQSEMIQYIISHLGMLLLGAGLAALFGLTFFIAFIIGLSGMKNATGINNFGTAMWLTIISILIGVTFPIGILMFGSGLSKLASRGGEKVGKPTGEEGARVPARREVTYCPYCGAKVESDALFCPTCGSSLKKEA